jgi:predicted permease
MLPVWEDAWPSGVKGFNSHFYETNWKIAAAIRPLKQEVIGNVGNVLWVVMATIGLVMLIACTNVANLLLVRADSRQQELAVRAALGASRGRIAWELLLESVVLGLVGGLLGIGIAYEGLRLLAAIGPSNLPRLSEISLDGRSLWFTLALSVLSGVVFGSIPVLKYVGARMPTALRGTGRTVSVSRERQRSRDLLVVAQVAMALVLLVSAMLMIRTFQALRHVEPGFSQPEHLQTLRISIPESLVADPQMVTRMQNNIVDKLAAIPGVTSVGFADAMPMEGIVSSWNGIQIEGKTSTEAPSMRLFRYVSPSFFHTSGTRMIAGRELTWTEVYEQRPVVIVSENLARESWGSAAAALHKRLQDLPDTPWFEVVGVVEDVHENGVQEKPPAMVYWPSMVVGIYGPHTFGATRWATFAVRSDRAGTEAFLRDSAGGLVSECEPAAGVGADHAGNLQPIPGAHFVHTGHAGHCRSDGTGARDHRHLWSDFLRGVATHARNRNSAGAGRAKRPAAVDVRPLRVGADGMRLGHRSGCGRRVGGPHEIALVWGEPDGSCYLRLGTDGLGGIRGAGQLSAGSACGGGESCGGSASGVSCSLQKLLNIAVDLR